MATILLIEDECGLRGDIAEELRSAGYEVMEAGDGESGLKRIHEERPDLVLCDISMPGLSGYEVVQRLREQHPECSDIPVVFLTALADRRAVVDGKQRGADDYLTKPIDFDDLLATVAARLRQIQRLRVRAKSELKAAEAEFLNILRSERARSFESAAAALDTLAIAIFLLGGDARILFANRAANALLAGRGPLTRVHGRLNAERGSESRALTEAIAQSSTCTGFESGRAVKLTHPEHDQPMLAIATPLAVEEPPGTADERMPRCVLFVAEMQSRRLPRVTHFAAACGLTPAEERVLQGLIEGRSPADIADLAGVTSNTVATQLKSLFRKTGTNRQSELVALTLLTVVWT